MHSNRTVAVTPARYIPFDNFHIAPLSDVTPDAIKRAAKLTRTDYQDRETLKQTTALNHISKRLGFNGGFAGYRQEYEHRLVPFMERNGLNFRKDLINRTDPGFDMVSLKPREVADRIFLPGGLFPRRIFTGYDVDWFELNNRYFHKNPWREHPDYDVEFSLPFESVMKEVAAAGGESSESGRQLLDAAVAACDYSIRFGCGNLLGDQLLAFEGAEYALKFVPCMYKTKLQPADMFQKDEKRMREVARIFRMWIERLGKGWVDVVPYNKCLVFLKGRDGAYDFVFPGLRDEPFDHNPFAPHLRNSDVPKSNDTYHFRRWLYFEYGGWLEEDRHHSEIYYYTNLGDAKNYPGTDIILRNYLLGTGKYKAPRAESGPMNGYIPYDVGGALLYVSNLVTIAEFAAFMQENADYARYSRRPQDSDDWTTVNSDEDRSLPAAATWYDANAYAAWASKTKKLPVRLLTECEYDSIARAVIQPPDASKNPYFYSVEHDRLCQFLRADGSIFPFNNLRPLGPDDFKAMRSEESQGPGEGIFTMRYRFLPQALVWKHSPQGLAFLVSNHFGEWLNDKPGAAVNTLYLTGLCNPIRTPSAHPFSPSSTGRYKGKKIGFRLCYLGQQASAPANQ
ncbi:MAG: hypothetical protein C5B50_05545 [Verrucomicrobia bacterium]|nr:MAG: hypothetical protein C5B50_05545 [Verrucomicrobiota bacterium]